MTEAQKHKLRLNEIKARLKEIAATKKSDMTDALNSEVIALEAERMETVEKLEAALVAEATDADLRGDQATQDGAFAEMETVAAQASVGQFFANLYEKAAHDGPIAELQAHYGLGRNDLPLDLLRGPDVQAAATPPPANVDRTTQPTVMPVWATGDGSFLGIDMPVVPAGDAVFPVLTTRPTVGGPHTDSTEVAETDGSFEAEVLQPARTQASFRYRRTDASRFADMDSTLRSALTMGLMESLDAEIVGQIIADVGRTAAEATAETFATYRKRLIYDLIDGRYAGAEGDLKLLVGSATLSHASGAYRSNTADDSAVDSLRRVAGGLKVSAHVPAVAGNLQDAIVRRGMRRDAVCPVWRNVSIIFDEVTAASTGEIVLTAFLQFAKKVVRTEGFARVSMRHSA